MNSEVASAVKDWLPYRLFEEGGVKYCRWLYLGDVKFREPFFEETMVKCLRFPENSHPIKSVSNLEILTEWADKIETLSPTVIIFHISRCGSTLLSQMLGMHQAGIVLSEVPFFDEILRSGLNNAENEPPLPVLKAAIELYGAKRNTIDQHLIIKTDSWHVHFYKQFRKLYPKVPIILLYRSPDEVIRSQQKKRGMQSIPGLLAPEIFGLMKEDIQHLGLDEYMARVIETYLKAFLGILATDPNAFPINYHEGPMAIVKKVAGISGMSIREDELAAMRQRSAFHGKFPEQVFEEAASREIIPPYLHTAFEHYEELEKRRRSFFNSRE